MKKPLLVLFAICLFSATAAFGGGSDSPGYTCVDGGSDSPGVRICTPIVPNTGNHRASGDADADETTGDPVATFIKNVFTGFNPFNFF